MTDTPDDALIEAIAEAIRRQPPYGIRWHEDLARAAYAAMVDHLGLEWRNSVKDMLAREPRPRRRLVSKWQKPARCGAEYDTANRPASNPPHVCVDEDPNHWPRTKHHDYSGVEWDQPEPKHKWGPP